MTLKAKRSVSKEKAEVVIFSSVLRKAVKVESATEKEVNEMACAACKELLEEEAKVVVADAKVETTEDAAAVFCDNGGDFETVSKEKAAAEEKKSLKKA